MAATKSDFERAVENFRKSSDLDEAELADFEITDLNALLQAINTIQNRQAQNKKLMYMKRLEPFLKTMEEYGKVLEVFLNVSDFIAFVWVTIIQRFIFEGALSNAYQGPMKYLLLVCCC
jgi:hypothetical protein